MNGIGIILTIIGTFLTVFNTISAIRWRRRNYNYRKQIDHYKNELEESNQKYIKNLNNKKELTEFINNFVKLSYSTIMSCVGFLYTLDFITKNLTKNNEYISHEKLEELLQKHFNIKKDINILKTDTTQLYLHSSDENEIALIGGTFNEIYFLNEFIEVQLMKHYKKEKINNRKVSKDIQRALLSSEDVLKIMNKLDSMLVNKLNILYSDNEGDGTMTFVTGTEFFKWYFPEYPNELKTLKIEDVKKYTFTDK